MRKYFKKFIVAVCSAALLCMPAANAYDNESLAAAKTLFDIGLMSGSSETFSAESMDLDSFATRAQLAVVITRHVISKIRIRFRMFPHGRRLTSAGFMKTILPMATPTLTTAQTIMQRFSSFRQ